MTSYRPAVADIHAAKTHCPHGHEYTEENTYRQRYTLADGSTGYGRRCRRYAKETVYRFRRSHPGYNAYRAWEYRERKRERAEGGSE